jgi:long-chain acyl-CoA synthetase
MTDFRSLAQLFLHRVNTSPSAMAYQFPKGDSDWQSINWKEAGERVKHIALGLVGLGLGQAERVAILSSTRVEWILADFGILCGAGATTTIYPSNTAEECAYILNDSQSVLAFAENAEQITKLASVKGELKTLKKVIVIDGPGGHDGWVISLGELERMGKERAAANPGEYQKLVDSVEPTHLATLIYTSGTTGKPKGVMLPHEAWLTTGFGIDQLGLLKGTDHQYLWLPLAHSFGKVLEVAQVAIGFPTTVDGRIPKLVDNLGVIKPTFMAAAPRIFEKVYNKVVTGATEAGGLKLKIFRWAMGVGREVSALQQRGQQPSGGLALQLKVADKLVFSKLRNRFGGRIRFFISGSAPLSREMAEFFHAAGILICEGYGLTESSAASFVNRPEKFRFGTVGLPVPGVQVKIAEDGEILLGGKAIMQGYYGLQEATTEALTEDRWLRTGDIGELDAEGFLRITDRKKDLIKTSGGKYVAPQKLEGTLKSKCPYLSQVIIHGDGRNFCVALVTLDEEGIVKWAAENGMPDKTPKELSSDPKVKAMIKTAVDELNQGLASYESVKDFAILPRDLTVEEGELTPSLKVKRRVVEKKYAALLDQFYQGSLKQV